MLPDPPLPEPLYWELQMEFLGERLELIATFTIRYATRELAEADGRFYREHTRAGVRHVSSNLEAVYYESDDHYPYTDHFAVSYMSLIIDV